MVCCQEIISSSSEDDHDQFQLWKDFPKGLRVLLLCNDASSASHTQAKLENMDYIVSWYSNFEEAQNAIAEGSESFHVAIIEVTSDNCSHSYKFLETARNLSVIVISSDSSLSSMMKCIALGAAEFLQKPLSEEKLRNIWQHVIHKAFSSSDKCETELRSLKPIKEMVASMIQSSQEEKLERSHENNVHEKLTRPSTPQLESKLRLPSSNIEESEERCIKSVENTCNDSVIAPNRNENFEAIMELRKHEEEVNSLQISKSDACSSVKEVDVGSKKKKTSSSFKASRDHKKKSKVDWTPELHKRFVKAVEQLGVDQAIPSKILELMKAEGLTRHNVASHLQKYRMHRRHILPKQAEERWAPSLKSYMQQRVPFVAPPPPPPVPFHHYPAPPPPPPFAPWFQQIQHQSFYYRYRPFQPWQLQPPPVPPVQQNWPWNSYPAINADTWGCPVYPPYTQYSVPPPMAPATCNQNGVHKESSNEFYLIAQDEEEEIIDKLVKEALAEPWAPLPLGLNPPSTDSVLSELHRLGIRTHQPESDLVIDHQSDGPQY